MTIRFPDLDRRTLLIGGGVGVGLVVLFAGWPHRPDSALSAAPGEQPFGHYIKISRDGRVTVAVPQAETGQGIWTALPQIAADFLGAAWESVAVEPAPFAATYANALADSEGWLDGLGILRKFRMRGDLMRMTAGSTSVRAFEQPLRIAGAAARAMLVAAAADRWDVAQDDCETADGFVIYGNRTLSFGELAEEAADKSPSNVLAARRGNKGRLIGQPLARLDLPAKSDGSLRFAGDVRLPNMLFASARLAPPGGKLTGFSRAEAEAAPGVRAIVVRNDWIAIAAASWWAAERALKAAEPRFTGRGDSVGDLRPLFADALAKSDTSAAFNRGDYAAAVAGSRPLAATYWVAPSLHLGLEPLSATARLSGDHLEVWAAAQAPEFARQAAIAAAGTAAARVTLYPMPVGDSAGRALEADAIPLAVAMARETGRPVHLTLSQSATQNHDLGAPGALAKLAALPGPSGTTTAWKMTVVTGDGMGSAMARLAGAPAPAPALTALDGAVPPYAIAHLAVEAVAAPLPFAPGYMRGSPQRELTFCNESFIDELARAVGLDPLAFRMAQLGGNPRLARCLQAVTAAAGWDGGGPGSSMGLACCSAFGSHIALVADATIGPDQAIVVHRLAATVDCGRIVNSGLVRQQVQAGLLWALAQAVVQAPEWVAGLARSRPIGALGLPRLAGMPPITVDLVNSKAPPGGVSGLGIAVLAPAVANAIFAGSGKRLRSLPFDLMAAA